MIVVGDTLRVAALLLYGGVIIGALWVVLTYYQIWLREKDNWIGLLPKHVYLIGLSYIAYATDSVVWVFQKWGEPPGPFTAVNVLAGAVGVAAIRAMLQYQGKRLVP